MQGKYRLGAAVLVSFALGVGVTSLLKAQSKLPGYIFVEIDVKDKDGYMKDFVPQAQANIKSFGGRYIAGGFNKAVSLSGAPIPNRVLLFQYPDMETAKAFNQKELELEKEVGSKYATFRAVAIEGLEQK